MKTLMFFVCAMFLVLPSYVFAQYGHNGIPTDIDVNGVFIGGRYSKAQVIEKWGEPSKYWSMMSEFGLDEEYEYYSYETGSELLSLFSFSENGHFDSFDIDDSNFAVHTRYMDGGIKVGDHYNKVYELTQIMSRQSAPQDAAWLMQTAPNVYFLRTGPVDDVVKFEFTDDGIVKRIWYTMSL